MDLQTLRNETKGLGLRWSMVQAVYCELKRAEREKREEPNAIRSTAWTMYTANSPGCWPFWRHGFLSRFGRRIARGADYTAIPGYDEIGQEIASCFPEYATDDGTERLWEFLLSPYDRLPDREQLYRRALCEAERQAREPEPEPTNLEF